MIAAADETPPGSALELLVNTNIINMRTFKYIIYRERFRRFSDNASGSSTHLQNWRKKMFVEPLSDLSQYKARQIAGYKFWIPNQL